MIIKTKVTFKEYVKLLYRLAYAKTIMRLILAAAALLCLWIILYYTQLLKLPKPVIYQYLTLILIVIVQPVVIFITILRNYKSSNHLRETLKMQITKDEIQITGESFYMEMKWKKMFRIVEKEDWFLLYQNNLSAIIIPKRDMNAKEVIELREILSSLKTVPTELEK